MATCHLFEQLISLRKARTGCVRESFCPQSMPTEVALKGRQHTYQRRLCIVERMLLVLNVSPRLYKTHHRGRQGIRATTVSRRTQQMFHSSTQVPMHNSDVQLVLKRLVYTTGLMAQLRELAVRAKDCISDVRCTLYYNCR